VSSTDHDRLAWETEGGPRVGADVPITSEPRDEVAPGVPRRPRILPQDRPRRDGRDGTEVREGRAEDPDLSPETNALLTRELREVVGSDRLRVPADRPHATRGEVPERLTAAAYLSQHRFQLIRATSIVLTFGAIISLITNDWWLLPVAAGVHALGTMTVTLTIIRMTSQIEHPSPELAAAMAEEGVSSPDERFSQMVAEFSRLPGRGTSEVISPGSNERTVPAHADTATASTEQASAMTPTEHPSRPAGEGGAPDLMIWSTAIALLLLSIGIPPAMGGGWLWLLTAVMVPLIAGWMVMQRLMITRGEQLQIRGRAPLVAIAVCTAAAVAVFCLVVAIGFHH
jgi:hypothetical protein